MTNAELQGVLAGLPPDAEAVVSNGIGGWEAIEFVGAYNGYVEAGIPRTRHIIKAYPGSAEADTARSLKLINPEPVVAITCDIRQLAPASNH